MSGYMWHGKPRKEPKPRRYTKVKCGTYSGYRTHYDRHEKMCEPCRQAGNKYRQEYRAANRVTETMHEGTRRLLEATAEANTWTDYRRK